MKNKPNILDDEYQNVDKTGKTSDEVELIIYSSYCQDLEQHCIDLENKIKLYERQEEDYKRAINRLSKELTLNWWSNHDDLKNTYNEEDWKNWGFRR